jgi:RNA polymerase sigma-70 factor (ECF subfamily)
VADRRRRFARGREPRTLPAGWDGYCERPLPEDVAADRELSELVHVALGLLAASERDLLWARYREGASVETLAARHGATPKAIEMRLYRARADLRRHLATVGAAWDTDADATQDVGPTGGVA